MQRLHSSQVRWFAVAVVLFLTGCGGSKPPGASPFPAKITLNPATSASLQQGNIISFTVSAQNASGSTISPAFVFASDNPSVLTLSPTGLACAGTWNAPLYTICTPAGVGVSNVTASALGETSPPTKVFVHRPIDNIQISVVQQLNSPPPACPTQVALPAACQINSNVRSCLSQNQIQTFQAQAFSQGTDITASVGPFTWSEANISVVHASDARLDHEHHYQPSHCYPERSRGDPSLCQRFWSFQPALPLRNLPRAVYCAGGWDEYRPDQLCGEPGNNRSHHCHRSRRAGLRCPPASPLTWTSSQPASVLVGSAPSGLCACGHKPAMCHDARPRRQAASITASCTPPTCNIGFPLNLLGLPPPLIPQPV